MSLFIDVTSIENNIKKIKEYTKKDIIAVIKDNAYGIGSKMMLSILKNSDVRWIAYNKYNEYLKDIEYNSEFKILIFESIRKIKTLSHNENLYYSVNDYEDALYIKDIKRKISL